MLILEYKKLRDRIYTRRERLLEAREAGQHWSVFFGTIQLVFMELRSIFLRFLILNFSDPALSFKVFTNHSHHEVCDYSYTSYKHLKGKAQLFSLTGLSLVAVASVLSTFFLSIILPLLALRAQTVEWRDIPQKYLFRKENLFTVKDWEQGYFLGTIKTAGLTLAPNNYSGDGRDGDLTVKGSMPTKTCRNSIFAIEKQRIITEDTTCLNMGDEVAILYFKSYRGKKIFSTYAINYVQRARGKIIELALPTEDRPEKIALITRVPHYRELVFKTGATLIQDIDGPIVLRAETMTGTTRSNIANLSEVISLKQGAWLSPIYSINTDATLIKKVAWSGEASLARQVFLTIASGNNRDYLYWDNENLVGCTTFSPCDIPAIHLGKKYVQFKITLTAEDEIAPLIQGLDAVLNQGYVSPPSLMGALDYQLVGVEWKEGGANDAVIIQVRGASTLAELKKAPWCGYQYCWPSDFFSTPHNHKKVTSKHDLSRAGNRWFQYRIFSNQATGTTNQKITKSVKLKLRSIPREVSKK